MGLITTTLFFLASLVVLLWAGGQVVRTLSKLAASLHISAFTLAFIVMALASTAPEFSVGVLSAFQDQPTLSLGNVLGSNLVNLGLILGLAAIVGRGIAVEQALIRESVLDAVLVGILPILLLLDSELNRVDGLLLLLVFVFYLASVAERRRLFRALHDHNPFLWGSATAFFKFFVMVAILLAAAYFTVRSGLAFGALVGLPAFLLGFLAIALGTSLPELVFALRSIRADREAFALGDLFGATVVNSTLVLGTTVLIAPISKLGAETFGPIIGSLVIFLTTFVAIRWFGKIGVLLGGILTAIYLAFAVSSMAG